ncbi:hypothetical protein [Mycolicibacterium elephantis]|uniref:hypothetical protein n=1 Tax=Mycolicibacterium elephantis TaxID=81858 RepID=UPI000FE25C57|nr:hypothetical protein [Mycolicibacterium elephantis]MCV7223158.1 hypothetical protein [Mycolicibacterium elephantis]
MTQEWPTLAHLAGEYKLKTPQAGQAAQKLGLNLRRGAAKVAPWQEKLLRPELEGIRREREDRKRLWADAAVAYEAADEHTGYIDAEDEAGRLGFSNVEWARQLRPILNRLQADEESS